MSTPINITDGGGQVAKVTRFGQLVTAPIDYSDSVTVEMTVVNTAFNLVEPKAGSSIVITDIISSAERTVSPTTPADIEVYEASSINTIVVDDNIVRPQLTAASNLPLTGLNLLVPEGKFVNAKTDDATVLVTVMFYRVPAEDI